MLTAILRKSQLNLQICNEISLIKLLLECLQFDTDMIAGLSSTISYILYRDYYNYNYNYYNYYK